MIHEGKRLEREIERLRRELEKPIGKDQRIETQAAIIRLQKQKREWERPR